MDCTSDELFKYEGKYPGLRAIGFLIAKAQERTNDPFDINLLQKLKERCLDHALKYNDIQLSNTLAYTQAINLTQKILSHSH